MRTVSERHVNARIDEIVNACAGLYETVSFKEITIKDIAAATSLTRTAVYNYFQTKEEIFLALLNREYALWGEQLGEIMEGHDAMSADELADALAHSLEKRANMLKLMSMNLYDIEENCRLESLVAFKRCYGASIAAVDKCLVKFLPAMTQSQRHDFIFTFFPLIYGAYPYAMATDKQQEAMRQAELVPPNMTIYDIACKGAKMLLCSGRQK